MHLRVGRQGVVDIRVGVFFTEQTKIKVEFGEK